MKRIGVNDFIFLRFDAKWLNCRIKLSRKIIESSVIDQGLMT